MHFESFFGTLAVAFPLLTRSLSPTGALGSDVVTLMLLPPNLVVELLNFTNQGRIGTFSMMYDQGIEIRSSSHFTLSHVSPTFKHTHTGTHTHTYTYTHSVGHGDSKAVVMFIFSFIDSCIFFFPFRLSLPPYFYVGHRFGGRRYTANFECGYEPRYQMPGRVGALMPYISYCHQTAIGYTFYETERLPGCVVFLPPCPPCLNSSQSFDD